MGRAILAGLIDQQLIKPHDVLICARRSAHVTSERYGVRVAEAHLILEQCEVVILAIKPQQIGVASAWVERWEIERLARSTPPPADAESARPLVISLLAGTSLDQLRAQFPRHFQLARVMPNLPAQVGHGVTLCCAESSDPQKQQALQRCHELFAPLGHVEELDSEESLHAATAISGCGPAYLFNLVEALADAGVHEGLKRDVALRLAAHTVWGSGMLAADRHPAILKDQVTSPGGVTIAGVRSLERSGFRSALIEAVIAASERSKEMTRQG